MDSDWSDEIVPYIQKSAGQTIPVDILREGQPLHLNLVPRLDGNVGRLGIQPMAGAATGAPRKLEAADFARAVPLSLRLTGGTIKGVTNGFVRLFTGRAKFKEMGGIITIAKVGSEAAKAGWVTFLATCSLISINLAILNALPIPFLDGGHVLILLFEKVRGKDLSTQIKERILYAGFLFLVTLMGLALAMDLWRLRH
jgi:regulator of sigma E protease